MSQLELKHALYRKLEGVDSWSGTIATTQHVGETPVEQKIVAQLEGAFISTNDNDPKMKTSSITILVNRVEGSRVFMEAEYRIGGYTMNTSTKNKVVITGFLYSTKFYNRGQEKLELQTGGILSVECVLSSL